MAGLGGRWLFFLNDVSFVFFFKPKKNGWGWIVFYLKNWANWSNLTNIFWKPVAQQPCSMLLLFQVTGATTDLPHVLHVYKGKRLQIGLPFLR